jgi:glutathione S-transferase
MRARMALFYANIAVEIREIVLRQKPKEMLTISPKGTVPVLELTNGKVIDESLNIMHWALSQQDKNGWLSHHKEEIKNLIHYNDTQFKPALDRYKYQNRFEHFDQEENKSVCEFFLAELNKRLEKTAYLFGAKESLADIALFPFLRQYSKVDEENFRQLKYSALISWIDHYLTSPLFLSIMEKYPTWVPNANPTLL